MASSFINIPMIGHSLICTSLRSSPVHPLSGMVSGRSYSERMSSTALAWGNLK